MFSASQNAAIRWCSLAGYTFNAPIVILTSEIFKIVFASAICIAALNKTPFPGPIRWGFSVNAGLYVVTNTLTFFILRNLDVSLYTVLSQHKMLFVLFLSTILLKKTYTVLQWAACMLVAIGIMAAQYSRVQDDHKQVNGTIAGLIITQGLCSAFSSIWIEKMMKQDKCDTSVFYTFLTDSLQMYIFSLPIYVIMAYLDLSTHTLPGTLTLALAINGACSGLFVGSILKYFSATVRALVHGGTVVISLILGHVLFYEHIGLTEACGAICVIGGIVMFSFF